MPSPLSVNKNNYVNNPKPNDIYTPDWLSKFLFDIVKQSGMKIKNILDPAIGAGALTNLFKADGSYIMGCDINDGYKDCADYFVKGMFQDIESWNDKFPDLIIVNPPFNSAPKKKLYPEVFLRHIEKLFGTKIPVIMITPMGMRLNQRIRSSRWKYLRDNWEITSIISLPIDAFEGVAFHSEIICFNTTGMKPAYFIPDIPVEEPQING